MKRLNDNELKKIKGKEASLGLVIGVSALVAFLVGVISGITNPEPSGGEKWKD